MTVEAAAPPPLPLPPDFPSPFAPPDEARYFWAQEKMHFPGQLRAIEFVALQVTENGFNANATSMGLPVRFRYRRFNTFAYQAIAPVPMTPEEMQALGPRLQETLQGRMQSMVQRWQTALTEIQGHLAAMAAIDYANATPAALAAHLDDVLGRSRRLWAIHFETVVPLLLAMSIFDEFYRDLFGGDAFSAFRLMQGLPNKSLENDQALWRLSRQALAAPSVRRILEERSASDIVAALEQAPEGRAFAADLRAYLAEYGQKGPDSINVVRPTWIEDPTAPIKNLKDMVGQPDLDLLAEQAKLAAEREALIAEARAKLVGYPAPVVGQFEGLLAAAQFASQLHEDHNFWIDQRGLYQMRRAIVGAGQQLAAAGAIDAAEDVYDLTWEEMREAVVALPGGDLRALVAERRADMARFEQVQPPPVIGTPPPESAHGAPSPMELAIGKMFGGPPKPSTEPGVLKGNAASPGVARGRARVVQSLTAASALEHGEILVCETTAPPWTPLFATAAAVVTDTGGILSHCAVVAREYQIPAVVGASMATATIKTGQLIEVDGDNGLIRIVE